MGFPNWTLWGMGLAALAALGFIALAFVGLTPGLNRRLGLGFARLHLRVKSLTGFALASMLLAIGFFVAGVPLPGPGETGAAQDTAVAEGDQEAYQGQPQTPTAAPVAAATAANGAGVTVTALPTTSSGRPATGAVIGVATETTAEAPASAAEEPAADATATVTATPSPSPTPTLTPTPTSTPTPISGETATITTGSSTVWIKRSPGGQNLVLVRGGDTIILYPGHANRGGAPWRQVMTVTGEVGWVPESMLEPGAGAE